MAYEVKKKAKDSITDIAMRCVKAEQEIENLKMELSLAKSEITCTTNDHYMKCAPCEYASGVPYVSQKCLCGRIEQRTGAIMRDFEVSGNRR
jgi:hypothetical protein